MNKDRLQKTLQILVKIDRLLSQLAEIDPYGELIESFAEFPYKYPPVTKRLIKMVKKDLRKGVK